MIWPNQNQPTSTLHCRPTADYWASDPGHTKVAKYTLLTVCVHMYVCMCVCEMHALLPCVGPSVDAYTLIPVES